MIALGRKNYLFAGSDAGGEHAAAIYSLIETAKHNGVDLQAYLADVIARIGPHPARHLEDLLPYNWQPASYTASITGRVWTPPWMQAKSTDGTEHVVRC